MPNYDLGTAHGRVVIDYDDHGLADADRDIDRLSRRTGTYGSAADKASKQTKNLNKDASHLSRTIDSLKDKFAALAVATAKNHKSITATIPTVRFLSKNMDVLNKSMNSTGFKHAGANLLLASRAFRTFSTGVARTMPGLVGSFLGLRTVIHGVPQEMKTWPKALRNIVALSAGLATLKTVTSGLQGAFSRGFAVPRMFEGIVSGARSAGGSIENLVSKVSQRYPRAMAAAAQGNKSFVSGLKDIWRTSDNAVTGIAQMSLGVVFAGRAAKSGVKLYHTLAWGIERFTWAMGAAGISSLAFLKVMAGGTTLIRGTGNALKQLSGSLLLLPGAAFAAGAGLVTMMVGGKGLGKALGAAVDPSQDLAEATKDLSESARDLVYQVREVSGGWGDLQKNVQQEMFKGTAERFRDLSDKYLPAMNKGMVVAASGINHFMQKFADFAGENRTVALVNKAFQDTGRLIANAGDAMHPFLQGMREIGSVGVTALADYSKAWQKHGQSLADWATKNSASGQMRKWMDSSIEGMKDLGSITANVGKTINNAFKPFYGGSVENALDRAAKGTEKWVSYMDANGPGGKAVQGFVDHLDKMAEPWRKHLPGIFDDIKPVIKNLLPVMEEFSAIAAREAQVITTILGPALRGALKVLDLFAPAIGVAVAALSGLRTLNWVRKGGMFLAAPFINALAAMKSFRAGIRNLGSAGNQITRATKGAAKGAKNIGGGAVAGVSSAAIGSYRALTAAINQAAAAQARLNALMRSGVGAAATAAKATAGAAAGAAAGVKKGAEHVAAIRPRAVSPVVIPASATKGITDFNRAVMNANKSSLQMRDSVARVNSAAIPTAGIMSGAAISARKAEQSIASVGTSAGKAQVQAKGFSRAMTTMTTGMGRFTSVAATGVTKSFGGIKAAANGAKIASGAMLGALGGPAGIAAMAAITGVAVATTSAAGAIQRTQEASRKLKDITTQQTSAFSNLKKEILASNGAMGEQGMAKSQRLVSLEMDRINTKAEKAQGVFGRFFDKLAGGEGANAVRQQESLSKALERTGIAQEDVSRVVAQGGSAYRTLIGQLRAAGDEGAQYAQKLEGVRQKIEFASSAASNAAPFERYSAALDLMSNSAGDADERLLRFSQSIDIATGSNQTGAISAVAMSQEVQNLATEFGNLGGEVLDAQGNYDVFDASNAGLAMSMEGVRSSMLSYIDTMAQSKTPFSEMVSNVQRMKDNLVQQAIGMGQSEEQANRLADAVIGIPSDRVLSVTAPDLATSIQGFRDLGIQAEVATDGKTITITDNIPAVAAKLTELGINYSIIDGVLTITDNIDEVKGKLEGFNNIHTDSYHNIHPDVPEAIAQITPLDALTTASLHTVESNTGSVFGELLEMHGVQTQSGNTVTSNAPLVKNDILSLNIADTYSRNTVNSNAPQVKGDILGMNGMNTGSNHTASSNVPPLVGSILGMNGMNTGSNHGVSSNVPQTQGMIFGLNGANTGSNHNVTDNVPATQGMIFGLNSANTNSQHNVADNVPSARGNIDGLNGNNTASSHKVSENVGAVRSAINGLNGIVTTSYHNVVNTVKNVINTVRGKATGGQYKGYKDGGYNNLPGYATGKRHHPGYRLPNKGPGTEIVDGFLALNQFMRPVARLDRGEWVINRKSSKKYKRELAMINSGNFPKLPGFAQGKVASGMRSVQGYAGGNTANGTTNIDFAFPDGFGVGSEFAGEFGKGVAVGMRGDKEYKDAARDYADALGIEFGKSARDENERLQKEMRDIKDENQRAAKEALIKDADELQRIADREFEDFARNNKFEAYGYMAAKSFSDGLRSGGNLISASTDGLISLAALAISGAGLPLALAGLAATAIKGLVNVLQDPDLWETGNIFVVLYKIVDAMLGGLVTGVLDILRNIFKFFGIELKDIPFVKEIYKIRDAANGATDALDKAMTAMEAMKRLEYKNLGRTGAANIDAALEASLGRYNNSVMIQQTQEGSSRGFRDLVVNAPSDKASELIGAATFEMKRV